MYDEFEEYNPKIKLLFDYQSDFRPKQKLCTETCLLHLTDYISFELDKSAFVWLLLWHEEGDTVDHDIL